MSSSRVAKFAAGALGIALVGAGALGAATLVANNQSDPSSAAVGVTQPRNDGSTVDATTGPPLAPKKVSVAPRSPGKTDPPADGAGEVSPS